MENMTRNELGKNWVDSTFESVVCMLNFARVPYEYGFVRDGMSLGRFDASNYTKQLIFPWAKRADGEIPDVVVGFLHADDLTELYGDFRKWDSSWLFRPYPSIETYRFPWDDDDVTVFRNPVAFVCKVAEYYADIIKDVEEHPSENPVKPEDSGRYSMEEDDHDKA